jgi:hypothetical protein
VNQALSTWYDKQAAPVIAGLSEDRFVDLTACAART